MRERWPLSIVGEGLRPARLAPPQVWAARAPNLSLPSQARESFRLRCEVRSLRQHHTPQVHVTRHDHPLVDDVIRILLRPRAGPGMAVRGNE
jgi:hypothetical protein